MSITIESKNRAIDLGYVGFMRLRVKVAELTAPDIFEHYKNLWMECGCITKMKENRFMSHITQNR